MDSTNFFLLFFAKATEHEIPQTSTGFTKTADRGREGRRRGAKGRAEPLFFGISVVQKGSTPLPNMPRPLPLPHTRESTEKTKDKNSYSSSVYTAYSQHTQREKSPWKTFWQPVTLNTSVTRFYGLITLGNKDDGMVKTGLSTSKSWMDVVTVFFNHFKYYLFSSFFSFYQKNQRKKYKWTRITVL